MRTKTVEMMNRVERMITGHGMTAKQVADKLGCSFHTALKYLDLITDDTYPARRTSNTGSRGRRATKYIIRQSNTPVQQTLALIPMTTVVNRFGGQRDIDNPYLVDVEVFGNGYFSASSSKNEFITTNGNSVYVPGWAIKGMRVSTTHPNAVVLAVRNSWCHMSSQSVANKYAI
jgi:hypothetical protein